MREHWTCSPTACTKPIRDSIDTRHSASLGYFKHFNSYNRFRSEWKICTMCRIQALFTRMKRKGRWGATAEFVKCFAVVILPPDFNEWIGFYEWQSILRLFTPFSNEHRRMCSIFFSLFATQRFCAADIVQIVRGTTLYSLWLVNVELRIIFVLFLNRPNETEWNDKNGGNLFISPSLSLSSATFIHYIYFLAATNTVVFLVWYAWCSS